MTEKFENLSTEFLPNLFNEKPQIAAMRLSKLKPPELNLQEPEPLSPPKEFSLTKFTDCIDMPCYKNISAGAGCKLPFTYNDDPTKVSLGVEARVSLFASPDGTKVSKGIVPAVRVTHDLGKNGQLMAKLSPSPQEYARIGVQVKF